jgi:mannan endo-1,4-beta-mannosidase
VRGFDFLQYTKSDSARAEQRSTDRALAWARRGGLVTYCVHLFMRAGSNDGTNPHFYVPSANNGKGTTVDIRRVVLEGTPENIEFIQKLDIMATELKRLRDARVPVIWRPLHECSGGWFWWGANGPEAFKQAWRIMFTRFTELHGLTNLIWCYNPTTPLASNLPDWYPGDDVVDMISLDVYPAAGTHPTYAADYARMRDFRAGRKAVAMSENGAIPDPDRFFSEGAGWSYFCTWNGFENDLSRNSVDFIRRVFAHEKVITLDELPALFQARAYTLVTQPVPQLVVAGRPLALAVAVRSDEPLSYQWLKDGGDVPGATGASFTVAATTAGDAGAYRVAVTGPQGTLLSDAATVGVVPTDAGRIVNLSVLATAGAGDQTFIAGVVLAGSAAPKELLIRAVGPSLAQVGVPAGFQADPALQLDALSGRAPAIAVNHDWGRGPGTSAADLALVFARVGAFPLLASSADAALAGLFSPGAYTATVHITGQPGVVLTEIYDASAGGELRLVNVSARGQVGASTPLTAGFVVAGDTRTVLVRAVGGKTLADLGVGGALANPRLELYRVGTATPVALNDEWTQTTPAFPTLNRLFARVGAFALDNGSKDAAVLINLPPGAYSAQIKSADSTSGIALVEVYEVR